MPYVKNSGVNIHYHVEGDGPPLVLQKVTSFLSVDSQHSPYDEEKLVTFCSTAQDLGMPVQFRIKNTHNAYLIGNILDLGPLAIEVPLVEDEAVVDEALDAFYYPQHSMMWPATVPAASRSQSVRPHPNS